MKVSWLTLERYALGECDAEEVQRVQEALATDSSARATLAAIEHDYRALPPLPAQVRDRRSLWALGGLLLAAVGLLAVGLRAPTALDGEARFKGGTVSLELVALRDGLATLPAEVGVGDRLGLRLTCPPGPTRVDVVAFHGGEAAFPVDVATLACGNRVLVPGAFSVDAPGPLVVCVALGDLPPRAALARGPEAADVCVEVAVRP